ncbi:CBS domain-containing protein [Allobacillus salarius]|uniref:CBS domain-containing protein n=2 Tax=Bacillaceae TaxID=186817 RepID=A0A556PKN7_9BACI|nr:CBS domain-containing protein [Allobacillus salarius]
MHKERGGTMPDNSDRYLAAFNRIEKALRTQVGSDEYQTFSFMVREASKKNAVVKRYDNDLREFADLRNAIVHNSTNPAFTIAEPHDSTVEKIKMIEEEIIHPKKVFPTFQKEVIIFQAKDSLAKILKIIREHAITQFPVYEDGKFLGLLSESGITNWLSKNVKEDIISLVETELHQVVSHEEEQQNYQFVDRDMSIYDAKEIFKDNLDQGVRIDALMITENGKEDEGFLGIMTRWDFLRIK